MSAHESHPTQERREVAWGNFNLCSPFAHSTIPEGKSGTTCSLNPPDLPRIRVHLLGGSKFEMNIIFNAQKKKKIKNQSIKLLFKEGETGVLHGIAVLFISTILSNKGQYKYMQQKRSKHGKCLIVQFWQFDLQCDCCFIQCQAFRSLYRSFKVFSPFLAMAEVAQDVGKVIVQMGTT